MYRIVFAKAAVKHKTFLKSAGLEKKTRMLLDILSEDPFRNPPPYEKLVGDLSGVYSRRINYQHRLVYTVDCDAQTVHVLSMWTHYETLK